ncbi:hypothetical protein ULMS_22280 [Patiriisocius marinistellae]|uniref:Uncharacterized protein n=1 Tax=Patiriisocius marinistellae TaxID=2494560 RepID=A0A5J4FWX0_9FLAO|nr:hypothetical protein [Patiriisocius marinistellae]GEQ86720.1 hypothetical protein ULMS_22280 [Patiriisocius marinistellae]
MKNLQLQYKLALIGAILIIIGAFFKLMHLGIGLLQAPLILGIGVILLFAGILIAIVKAFKK